MTNTIQSFDFSLDLLKTILWQYENAPNIKALVTAKQAWYAENQTALFDDYHTDIFNLDTANDFGLAVWAIVLDAPIVYNLSGAGSEGWGFGAYRFNFTNGNFQENSGTFYRLSTETARVVLKLRYYKLIGTCTAPAINRALADVFKDYGSVYVVDNLDMTQAYSFSFTPPTDLRFMLDNYDILPRPAGVGSDYVIVPPPTFGFNPDGENFSHGNLQGGNS